MTPEERAEVFVGLDRTMEAILANLLPEDRRRQVSRLLDPRPTPWWNNLRRSVWPHDDAAPELPPLADVVLRLTDVFKRLGVPSAIGEAGDTSFWGVPRTPQRGRLDIPYLCHWSGQMLSEPAVRELDDLIASYESDQSA